MPGVWVFRSRRIKRDGPAVGDNFRDVATEFQTRADSVTCAAVEANWRSTFTNSRYFVGFRLPKTGGINAAKILYKKAVRKIEGAPSFSC